MTKNHLDMFCGHIEWKIKSLEKLKPATSDEEQVITSQKYLYTAVLWEIDLFLEGLVDDQRDKFTYLLNVD